MKAKNYFKIIISIFLFSLFITSCNDTSVSPNDVHHIRIEKGSVKLSVGEKVNMKLSLISQGINKDAIKWVSGNTAIAAIDVNPDKTCIINGVSVGTTTIKVFVEGTELVANCIVTVGEGGIIKILAIGNSFSEDAVETYLYDLAKAADKTVIIGNLYIGGCSLETHLDNTKNDASAYSYRKIDKNGNKTTHANYSISRTLEDENWDYISFQQVSQNSGQYATYSQSLPGLYKYVAGRATNMNVKFMLHQTWAYQQNSTHSGFANYSNSQAVMYDSIMTAVEKASKAVAINIVIPSGTAIQNGRTSIIGDNFCRDGYHLNEGYGRFTAACTWFEKIFNIDATTNSYKPASVSEYDTKIAKAAAHAAVLMPYQVTELTQFQTLEPIELKNPIYINFNKNIDTAPFQGLVSFKDGSIANLADDKGNLTGASIKMVQQFSGGNDLGVSPTTIGWLTGDASKYAFFGDASHPKAELIVSNLLKDKAYSFTFFGSRKDVGDNRETSYNVIGKTTEAVLLNASSNASTVVSTSGIKPDNNGVVKIEVSAGPNNNNGSKYYYINSMMISPK